MQKRLLRPARTACRVRPRAASAHRGEVRPRGHRAIAPILQRPVQRVLCRSESLFQDASRVLGVAGLAATLDPLRQPNADTGRDEARNNSHEEGVPTLETNSVLVVVVIRPTCGRVVAHLSIMARPKVMVQAAQRRSRDRPANESLAASSLDANTQPRTGFAGRLGISPRSLAAAEMTRDARGKSGRRRSGRTAP